MTILFALNGEHLIGHKIIMEGMGRRKYAEPFAQFIEKFIPRRSDKVKRNCEMLLGV